MVSAHTNHYNISFNTSLALTFSRTGNIFCEYTKNNIALYEVSWCLTNCNEWIEEVRINIIHRSISSTFQSHLCSGTYVIDCSGIFVNTLEEVETRSITTGSKLSNTRSKGIFVTTYREGDFIVIGHVKAVNIFYIF